MKIPSCESQKGCWLSFTRDVLDFNERKLFAGGGSGLVEFLYGQYSHVMKFLYRKSMVNGSEISEIVRFRRRGVLLRSSYFPVSKGCSYAVRSFGDLDPPFVVRFSYCLCVKLEGFLAVSEVEASAMILPLGRVLFSLGDV